MNAAIHRRFTLLTSKFHPKSLMPYKGIQVISKYTEGIILLLKRLMKRNTKINLISWDPQMMGSIASFVINLPLFLYLPMQETKPRTNYEY